MAGLGFRELDGVRTGQSGQLVGLGGLRVQDGERRAASRLHPEAQGKGYGPELGRAALAFAFDVVGLDRVVAITRLDNLPGQRSLEKVGMRRERAVKLEGGRTVLLYAAFNPKNGRMNHSGRTTER